MAKKTLICSYRGFWLYVKPENSSDRYFPLGTQRGNLGTNDNLIGWIVQKAEHCDG